MALDLLGPSSNAPGAVTTRPSDGRAFTATDTWFKDCTSPTIDDGTEFQAAWFNQLLAELRSAIRANGLTGGSAEIVVQDNSDDDLLRKAIQHLIQRGIPSYAADSGGANNMVIAPSPACPELINGLRFIIKVNNTNTGNMSLSVSGLSSKPVAYDDGNTLMRPGDVLAGSLMVVAYSSSNGGYFQIIGFLQSAIKKLAFKRTRVTFTTPGAFSWPVPAGVSTIKVYGWGGGGGGGFSGAGGGGSGGGGGARGEQTVDVVPGQTITGNIGAGGSASSTTGGTASAGGNTTITVGASTYIANGGAGGLSLVSGTANSVSGGSPSIFSEVAQVGEPSAGGLHGYSGSGDLFYAGKGGNSPNGGLGGLAGTGAGNPGLTPGGGGAGGANNNAAGNGARGEVWIEY